MRKYTGVDISDAAVHVVAPKRGDLHLSTAALALDDAVRAFLVAHVEQGLADGQAVAGRFKVTGRNRTEGICRQIVKSAAEFVNHSGKLASNLYTASSTGAGSDSRVSDGTLVVARSSAAPGNAQFVALLKLDPNDAFRAEDTIDKRGRPVVKLVRQPNILPTPRERVQKAAFVRGTGHEYDALAVDRQRRGDVVSQFFLDGFLGIEHVFDAKERTEQLYKTLQRTFEEVKGDLNRAEYTRLDRYIRGQVVGGRVKVDDIIDAMPGPQPVQDAFKSALDAALPDREFDTDPGTIEKLLARRTFRADNGLRVSVPSRFYDDMVDAKPPAKNSAGEWTITIKTTEWTET